MSILTLVFLCVVSFIQNMAFTWASRSRNSSAPWYHFRVALGSNSVWFICNFIILLPEILKSIESGSVIDRVIIGAVYVFFTSLGSVAMMIILLKKEKGKKRVGSFY